MTKRPIFLVSRVPGKLLEEVPIEFSWSSGFAPSQKRKNIIALHKAAADRGFEPLLEVSTKSEHPLGQALSAFALEVGVAPGRRAPIEVAYQSSKVFQFGGPFADLLTKPPKEAKRDERLATSGPLVAFRFGGKSFPTQPVTAFYDWLFVRALSRRPELVAQMSQFVGFTDIEFNPAKSINCQARSCAAVISLAVRSELQSCAKSFARFAAVVATEVPNASYGGQTEIDIPGPDA